MKSVNENVDENFNEAYQGAQLKPVFHVEYLDNNSDWQELPEVLKASFSSRVDDNRKLVYSLIPPASTLNLTLDNKGEQYTTGAGGVYDGIISIGRKVRLMVTYELE